MDPTRRFCANGAGEGGRELGRSGSTAGGIRRRHGGDGRVARIGVRSAPRAVYSAAAHQGGLLASMAPGRHLGGGTQGAGCGPADAAYDAESADVGLGLLCGAVVAGRAGMEGGAGSAPAVPPSAADERGQPVLIVVQDARLDPRPSRGAQAAHPEGYGALVARVAAGLAGRTSSSAADGGGHPGLLAGQQGREAAGVRPVVRLPHVLRFEGTC